MGYKHRDADAKAVMKVLQEPNFLVKIIPHVDGTPRILELVREAPLVFEASTTA
jgi:acetoacetate decarboxylase